MSNMLPSKLGKEPLIDVVFEIRFTAALPAGGLLPGLVLPLATAPPTLEALPASQLPAVLRDQQPDLRHVALLKMTLDEEFVVLFGDRSMAVGCVMPYVGWAKFKAMILRIFGVLRSAPFITKIERHSLKYVDFFPTDHYSLRGLEFFNLNMQLGQRKIKTETTFLRSEFLEEPFLHAVSITSKAKLTTVKTGSISEGSVLDVDTHCVRDFSNLNEFLSELPDLTEKIHDANKSFFFGCLSETGLKELEPKYE